MIAECAFTGEASEGMVSAEGYRNFHPRVGFRWVLFPGTIPTGCRMSRNRDCKKVVGFRGMTDSGGQDR